MLFCLFHTSVSSYTEAFYCTTILTAYLVSSCTGLGMPETQGGLTAQTPCQFGIPISNFMCYLASFGLHSANFLTSRSCFFLFHFFFPLFCLFSHSFIIRGPAASCLLQVWWTFLVKSREDYCRNWYRFQEFRNGSGQPRPEQGVS